MMCTKQLVAGYSTALCVLVVLFVLSPVFATFETNQSTEKPADESYLKKLVQERADVLDERVKMLMAAFHAGNTSITVLLNAREDALLAKLDLHQEHAARLALRLDETKQLLAIEKRCQLGFQLGNLSRDQVLAAKAARLSSEIALLRERQQN